MARRGFPRSHGVRSDRQNVWASIDFTVQTIAANTLVLLGSLNVAALALRPFTIIRTRAQGIWASDQTTGDEWPHGALGMVVVSDQAIVAGAASIPDPVSNADAPWHVWQGLETHISVATEVGFVEIAGQSFEIDSKAMRKIGVNEDVAVMVVNAHATHGARVGLVGRFLIKTH